MKEGFSGHLVLAVCVVLVLISSSLFSGCVEVGAGVGSPLPPAKESMAPSEKPSYVPPQYPANYQNVPQNYPTVSAEQETAPGLATYTEPIPPPIAGNMSHRELHQSSEFFPRPFDYPTAPFFQESYALSWNNIGLLAKPSSPPFVIEFKVDASTKNPYDARVLLTVRENSTGWIVAEEGYNGEYSSEAVKRVVIREAGEYHINLYGYRATVHLVLRGGVPEDQAVPYGTFISTRSTGGIPLNQEGPWEEWVP